MTRLIDADEIIKYLKVYGDEEWTSSELEGLLNNALTIDAVEVVKCKECRKQGSDDCPMFSREWRTIMRGNECVDDFIFHDLTKPSGFCNYGERQCNYFGKRRE